MNQVQLSDKIFAVESKISKANALLGDMCDEYFSKNHYNILSEDEMERFAATNFLNSHYPRCVLLINLLLDTTIEAERMIKELGQEIDNT